MARTFAPISIDTLAAKVVAACSEPRGGVSIYKMKDVLAKDIKVSFDNENWEMTQDSFGPEGLMGYHTLPNGLTFLGVAAGGDWEHPVFFCVYWDGKKLRAYVPTEGNPWNTTTKEAYGNNEDDYLDARKRWPDGGYQKGDDITEFVEFDPAAIIVDMQKRLVPAGAGAAAEPEEAAEASPSTTRDEELYAFVKKHLSLRATDERREYATSDGAGYTTHTAELVLTHPTTGVAEVLGSLQFTIDE